MPPAGVVLAKDLDQKFIQGRVGKLYRYEDRVTAVIAMVADTVFTQALSL